VKKEKRKRDKKEKKDKKDDKKVVAPTSHYVLTLALSSSVRQASSLHQTHIFLPAAEGVTLCNMSVAAQQESVE
jgi:hypothetical protein